MKYFCTLLTTLWISVSASAFRATQAWVAQHYMKTEVMIPMRDGVRLYTAVYAPRNNDTRHPVIYERTPYSCTPYGTEMKDFDHECWLPYLEQGYILVFQDVRGRNYSEGEFEDIRPFVEHKKKRQTDEASDAYDTAEWLVHHTHKNGNIGVMGISYPGFYATMAALSGHPAIKAVSPQAPITDWYRGDDSHHNGAFFQGMWGFSYWFQYVNCRYPATGPNPTHISMSDEYSGMLRIGAMSNITRLLGDSVTMWNNVVAHPDLDEWWEERNVSLHCHDIRPAVMLVGGLFDAEDLYGTWRTYRAIREQSPETELYLAVGPWGHGDWSRGAECFFGDVYMGDEGLPSYYMNYIEYPFFAYYLEGKGEKPAAARVFQTGENRWYTYSEGWQKEASEDSVAFHFGAGGALSTENIPEGDTLTIYSSDPLKPVPATAKPAAETPRTYMIEDQRFAATRPDVAVFVTPPLTDTLRADGPVLADLLLSIDATDADFVVKVIDVFPDDFAYPDSLQPTDALMGGYQMLVRAEIMRGKYRYDLSSPEPFVPGHPTRVTYTLPDVAHTWLPGHRLMVQVQSSWYPLVDRNPQQFCDIYHCTDSDFRPCHIALLSGSRIVLSMHR